MVKIYLLTLDYQNTLAFPAILSMIWASTLHKWRNWYFVVVYY